MPTLIVDRILTLISSIVENACPSIIEIALVEIYAGTSPAFESQLFVEK
jgi:hypothetical protein